jgi:signal transduction histidine kinase
MLAGCCVLRGRRWDGVIYWTAALVLFAAEWTFAVQDPGWAAWSAGTTFSLLAALLVRHEMRLTAELRTAQAGLVDRARIEERNRIARELHDVIAHSLTVSLLHVTSARVALQHAPDDAERALAEAERIGRETLDEVRGTVGLLREDGGAAFNRPQPGADDLAALVAGFRSAGADVDLTVAVDGQRISDIAGLTVYRIAQEALTNAAKHAPGSAVRVALSVAGQEVSLVVESSGPGGSGTGLGLLSMQERAAAVGGSCQAGPADDGWVVRAMIPA